MVWLDAPQVTLGVLSSIVVGGLSVQAPIGFRSVGVPTMLLSWSTGS